MAGTITGTILKVSNAFYDRPVFLKVTLTCTADAALASYPATVVNTLGNVLAYDLTGMYLYLVEAYPGGVAPTDATDLTITMDGVDILGGNGTNLIDATSYTSCLAGTVTDSAPIPITGNITVNISNNLVNSAICTLILTFVTD